MKRWIVALVILTLSAAPDPRTPHQKAIVSSVMIESGDGHGSGVRVLDGSYILTAAHVVAGVAPVIAYPPGDCGYGPGLKCVVVKSDPSLDLTLLKVEGKGIPMMLGDEPLPADELMVIGGANAPFGVNKGHCRAVYHKEYPTPLGHFSGRVVDISVPINFGDSGGPLVADGKLAGIVVAIDAFKNQTSFAVSITEIRSFLERPWTTR